MLTTLLELGGVGCLIAFALIVWWPSALLVAGAAALLFAWRLA